VPWQFVPDENDVAVAAAAQDPVVKPQEQALPPYASAAAQPQPQPQPASPTPQPAPTLPTSSDLNQPPPIQPGQSHGYSQSQGESGFSLGRNQAVKSTQTRLDRKQNQAYEQANDSFHREAQMAAITNEFQREAVGQQSQVMSEQEAARSSLYREQARMASMFAAAEATAADLARERTVQYRARFEQTAAQAAAMQVNPGLKLSAGQGMGLAAALFAQGFLGSQGIPVADVRGMVSNMVDRNIQLQEQQIAQGHQLSEDQARLWQMARAEASDDSEARTRLRGLMLAQAATAMDSEMSKYNSRLATAKGMVASADLRAELNKTLGQLTDRYFNQYMQQSGLELDRWKAEVAASQESKRIAIAQQEANARASAAKAAANPLGDVIFDTSKSGKGQAKWMALPGTNPETKDEIRTREAAQSSLTDRYRAYEDLSREAGEVYGGWGKAMLNDKFASQVQSFRAGLIADYVLAKSGKQASDAERKALEQRFPLDTWLNRDGQEKVRLMISDLTKEGIDSADRYIGAHAVAIPEQARGQFPTAGINQYARGELTEADVKGQRDISPVSDFYSRRSEEARAPHSDLTDQSINAKPGSDTWQQFIKAQSKSGTLDSIEPSLRDPSNRYDSNIKLLKGIEPSYASSMDYLYHDLQRNIGAQDPEQQAKAQRAAETLKALAEDTSLGYKTYYAGYLLDQLGIPYQGATDTGFPADSSPAPVEGYSTEAPLRTQTRRK